MPTPPTADFDLNYQEPILPLNPEPVHTAGAVLRVMKAHIANDLSKKMAFVSESVSNTQAQIYLSHAKELNDIADTIDQIKGRIGLDLAQRAGELSTQAMMAGASPPAFLDKPDQPLPTQYLHYVVRDNNNNLKVVSVPQGQAIQIGDKIG